MAEFCKIRSDGSAMAAPNPLRIVIGNPLTSGIGTRAGWKSATLNSLSTTQIRSTSPTTGYRTDSTLRRCGQCMISLCLKRLMINHMKRL